MDNNNLIPFSKVIKIESAAHDRTEGGLSIRLMNNLIRLLDYRKTVAERYLEPRGEDEKTQLMSEFKTCNQQISFLLGI